ncbi:hypothetical protein [Caballeronia sp. J97]|uniref:hypothetical protein n=1 Tax=Caballeronia sp. J97 TaxID=2805429 RepID=UPI002AAF1B96|nr:hypothetical protein [Caballeronia sp. J97]
MFIHHLSNFRQKIDRVLSTGLVARVQAARLGLTGVLLGLASKQTFHWMMRVRKCNSGARVGSSKKFPNAVPAPPSGNAGTKAFCKQKLSNSRVNG